MRLLIAANDGTILTTIQNIDTKDLDDPITAAALLLDIQDTINDKIKTDLDKLQVGTKLQTTVPLVAYDMDCYPDTAGIPTLIQPDTEGTIINRLAVHKLKHHKSHVKGLVLSEEELEIIQDNPNQHLFTIQFGHKIILTVLSHRLKTDFKIVN